MSVKNILSVIGVFILACLLFVGTPLWIVFHMYGTTSDAMSGWLGGVVSTTIGGIITVLVAIFVFRIESRNRKVEQINASIDLIKRKTEDTALDMYRVLGQTLVIRNIRLIRYFVYNIDKKGINDLIVEISDSYELVSIRIYAFGADIASLKRQMDEINVISSVQNYNIEDEITIIRSLFLEIEKIYNQISIYSNYLEDNLLTIFSSLESVLFTWNARYEPKDLIPISDESSQYSEQVKVKYDEIMKGFQKLFSELGYSFPEGHAKF